MSASPPGTIRVASVPGRHPYVTHLGSTVSVADDVVVGVHPAVHRLPDPLPDPAEPARWWPPVMLDAAWVRANADTFDVMHLHFGFESYSTTHLRELLDALREARKPFVYTVHDLTNPQLADQAAHVAQLDILIPRADALITLTDAAAAEILARWDRTAVVIAHPHVVPFDADLPAGSEPARRVVGMHLRDLRPNIDAERATATLLAAVARLRSGGLDVVARIDMNESVRDAAVRESVRGLVEADPTAELVEHPRYGDAELHSSLAGLDVAVLPYRHGTHSGWVELCWDLAVPVAGPRVGYSAAQHTEPEFFSPFDAGDERSLSAAIASLLASNRLSRPGSAARADLQHARRRHRYNERRSISRAHHDVYRDVLAALGALRIAVIAPIRYPIGEPHAGGLEATVWNQVVSLRRRGHDVVLCAPDGSAFLESSPPEFVLPPLVWNPGEVPTDSTYPEGYLDTTMPALTRALSYISDNPGRFDIVDNNSLHGEPLTWASRLGIPMVSTLHTPTLPVLLDAHAGSEMPRSNFLAVSHHTAAEWGAAGISATVVPNAIDTDRWAQGPGGTDLVWFGRIVPEKGLHLALEAARIAGLRLVIAGRIGDVDYFTDEVEPLLGPDAEFVGPLGMFELAALVGRSACALVTPVWEEPFGLVIAEAMATGTPVAAFASGGVAEVLGSSPGTAAVAAGDSRALAAAAMRLIQASADDATLRDRIRASAVERFSLTARARRLEGIYHSMIADYRPSPSAPAVPR